MKIDKKIVGWDLAPAKESDDSAVAAPGKPTALNETLERPESLYGTTYKIKTPLIEHAMYVTINDVVLDPGTEHERRRPFEVFINSKNMEQFQWIVALTRIMSAVFRKGGDVTFLVEEMRAVFDPRGGYFKPGGKYMPSVLAEIGDVLQEHFSSLGMMEVLELTDTQTALINEKRQALAKKAAKASSGDSTFPDSATVCPKCQHKALVRLDGCDTCLNCAHSKCG